MGKRKAQESRADTFNERLDTAVMAAFPDVECETELNIFAMRKVTSWWPKGNPEGKVKPALARQVRAFVSGFSAAEEFSP